MPDPQPPRSVWPATSLEWGWLPSHSHSGGEELGYVDVECEGESVEDVDGRVEFLALDAADVGPIDRSIDGQILLRDPTFDPEQPEVIGNTRTPIHGGKGPSCPRSHHGIYST